MIAAVLTAASLLMVAAGIPAAAAGIRHGRPFRGLPYVGGYQQGGSKPWISYSPYFGGNIRALYHQAVAKGF